MRRRGLRPGCSSTRAVDVPNLGGPQTDARELLPRELELLLFHLILGDQRRLYFCLTLDLCLRLVGEVVSEATVGGDSALAATVSALGH